jgi:PAT family beta-lactamase induction signal transducer AmpG
MGYRLAMIVSGRRGLDLDRHGTRRVAGLAAGLPADGGADGRGRGVSALALPALPDRSNQEPRPPAGNDLRGFAAVLLAVAVGAWLSDRFAPAIAGFVARALLAGTSLTPVLQQRWLDLLALLLGLAFTLPLAAWTARRARFTTLLGGLESYFATPGAAAFLLFIVLYKLGDAFAGSLMTPFLLQSMAYHRPRSASSTR